MWELYKLSRMRVVTSEDTLSVMMLLQYTTGLQMDGGIVRGDAARITYSRWAVVSRLISGLLASTLAHRMHGLSLF